jgi:hypothetical protein
MRAGFERNLAALARMAKEGRFQGRLTGHQTVVPGHRFWLKISVSDFFTVRQACRAWKHGLALLMLTSISGLKWRPGHVYPYYVSNHGFHRQAAKFVSDNLWVNVPFWYCPGFHA